MNAKALGGGVVAGVLAAAIYLVNAGIGGARLRGELGAAAVLGAMTMVVTFLIIRFVWSRRAARRLR